nr:hypothetical protein [Tanacetum cinerariifolium]
MRDQEYASWDLNIVTWVCWGEYMEGFWYGAGVRENSLGKKRAQWIFGGKRSYVLVRAGVKFERCTGVVPGF